MEISSIRIDFLGAASPHKTFLPLFFLAFCAVMTAMRVLMCWVYFNTESVLIVQLMHACSTGFLVMLSPGRITPAEESLWYGAYAVVLWLLVLILSFYLNKQRALISHKT